MVSFVNSNINGKNLSPNQLNVVKDEDFYNSGLGIIDLLEIAEKDFKNVNKDLKLSKKNLTKKKKKIKKTATY